MCDIFSGLKIPVQAARPVAYVVVK
jgi:hypothetical protein